jgi:hypothetical protein
MSVDARRNMECDILSDILNQFWIAYEGPAWTGSFFAWRGRRWILFRDNLVICILGICVATRVQLLSIPVALLQGGHWQDFKTLLLKVFRRLGKMFGTCCHASLKINKFGRNVFHLLPCQTAHLKPTCTRFMQ